MLLEGQTVTARPLFNSLSLKGDRRITKPLFSSAGGAANAAVPPLS